MAKKLKGCEIRFYDVINPNKASFLTAFENGVERKDVLKTIRSLYEHKEHLGVTGEDGIGILIPFSIWNESIIKLENVEE